MEPGLWQPHPPGSGNQHANSHPWHPPSACPYTCTEGQLYAFLPSAPCPAAEVIQQVGGMRDQLWAMTSRNALRALDLVR